MAEGSSIALSHVSDGSADEELLYVEEYIKIVEELPGKFHNKFYY